MSYNPFFLAEDIFETNMILELLNKKNKKLLEIANDCFIK